MVTIYACVFPNGHNVTWPRLYPEDSNKLVLDLNQIFINPHNVCLDFLTQMLLGSLEFKGL